MKAIPVFAGNIKDGQMWMAEPEALKRYIESLEGKAIELRIGERARLRSLNQNSYFHGVICELISESTGYEPEEVKEILKQKFLLVDDGKFPHCRGTSELSTTEMARFTDQCIRWAATELNVIIPDPEVASV